MSGSDTLNKEQKITEQEEKLESKEIIKQKFEKFQLAMDSLEKEVFSTKDFSAKASSYLVHHAGIVILNPYFSPFLKNCGLVTEEGKLNNPSLAVQVINYLATGKENRNEEQMVFEKFICDYPIESPLYFQSIPEYLKLKCDELLENIIQNWDTLKSSSIDLLRNEFLQRPGKIELDKEFPIVRLERKTQDILVDRIPWNLSIIKLPWKKKMFHTIW